MKLQILIKETIGIERKNEPLHIPLETEALENSNFDAMVTLENGEPIPCQVYTDFNGIKTVVLTISCNSYEEKKLTIETTPKIINKQEISGFRECPPDESLAAVKKIDTGVYVFQIGTGLADGSLSGKWGINFLERKEEGINLIDGNAFGGVYGPFFTQENSCEAYHKELGVGSQHYSMDFHLLDDGPVFWRGMLEGTPPDGADANVSNKRVTAYFMFYAHSNWFERVYFVDEYETCIWGEKIKNKLTVGDETNITKNGHTAFQEICFFQPGKNKTRYLLGGPPRQSKIADGWLDIVDKTIWPIDVQNFVLRNRYDDFSLLYSYSQNIHSFQIDNFESSSDWFNVGTNGFCEIPNFPSGTRIRNAYGQFQHIEEEMEKMICPLEINIL